MESDDDGVRINWRFAAKANILCLRHKLRELGSAGALTYTSLYILRHNMKKPLLHPFSLPQLFIRPQSRYSADNYAKFLVVFQLTDSYTLMPIFPISTVSSLGKLGSAVKRAPVSVVTRHAKRQPEWYFTTR